MLIQRLRRTAPTALVLTALPVAALLVLALCRLPRAERERSTSVAYTLEVLAQTATLEDDLLTVTRAGRNAAIDRTEDHVKRFDALSQRVAGDLASLRALTVGEPVQQAALDRLDPLVMTRIGFLRELVEQAETGVGNGALNLAWMRRTGVVTDQIQNEIASMRLEEQHLLVERNREAQQAAWWTLAVVVGCGVLVVAKGLLALMLLIDRRRARTQAERESVQMTELQEANARLEILNGIGAAFAAELDQTRLVEGIVGAAMRLTGAAYAALFERAAPGENGNTEAWRLSSLAGAPPEAFTRFNLPRMTALFGPTFRAEGVVRSDDVLADPRYGALGGMPAGHLPVRSYLAVPVLSRTGERLGALLFGHPEPGRFGVREEGYIVGLAGQAATALDNARLFQAVQREQDRFRAAVRALQGVLWTNNAEGRMVGEQPGWAALTGQSFEEYQGYGWTAAVHPADVQPSVNTWNQAVAGRHVFVFEHRVRRHDGAWRTFAVRAVPVLEADGAVREWVGVHTDITERREAETANARLAAIVTSAGDAIISFAPDDGHILTWNAGAERLFGYTPAEAVGNLIDLFLPSERIDVDEPLDVFKWAMSGQPVIGCEVVCATKAGDRIPVAVNATRMLTPDGRVMGVSAILHDLRPRLRTEAALHEAKDSLERRVTERTAELRVANAELERLARHLAKTRDAAEQASRAKSRFLAATSHELRTPLNGILGYAQLLRLEGGLSAAQDARVDAMLGAGAHLLEMINRVLDLSEVEAERVELRASDVDLAHLAGACLDLVRPTATVKGLELDLDAALDAPRHVTTDSTRLRQVLVNLLGNAVKFTTQGTVALRLRRAAADGTGAVRIEVADTGPGIPTERRHRLFQDFERLDADRVGRTEGAGLGLALSARLAALLGGRLSYDDNPGGGSVFWLELPLAMGTGIAPGPIAEITPTPGTSSVQPTAAHPLRVLVADDVAMNRDVADAFLRAAGHVVVCAEDGAGAVAAAAAADYDVILMDVRMPEMDGLEATRRIRALPGPRGRVPVVALTAQAFAEQVAECQAAGMDGHLAKPFAPEALLAAVARAAVTGRTRGGAGARAAVPAVPAPSTELPGAELAVLDRVTLERTVAFLSPEAVASYLRTIAERGETLQRALRAADALASSADGLAEAAHTLAGSAGMFGFERLATVARRFERAVQAGAADTPALANALAAAVDASLSEINGAAVAASKLTDKLTVDKARAE